MNIEEIYKILSVDKLDESQQTAVKDKIADIIDLKVKEKTDSLIKEEKKNLVEQYTEKFEKYKKEVTSNFSNFVDSVIEEELKIPKKVLEYSKLGEEYKPIIDQLKVKLAIDEGLLTNEIKALLKEAKDEIKRLRSKLNKYISERNEIMSDAKEMATHIYLRKKCDGLTESQRNKVLSLLGDIENVDEIDRKFKIVMEDVFDGDENDEDEDEKKDESIKCPECDSVIESNEVTKCPSCGADIKINEENDEDEDEDDESGKGRAEVNEENDEDEDEDEEDKKLKEKINENKKIWLKVLKEGKL